MREADDLPARVTPLPQDGGAKGVIALDAGDVPATDEDAELIRRLSELAE